MLLRPSLVLAAGALAALAAWPLLQRPQPVTASGFAPASVNRDYLRRNAVIAFEEAQVRRNAGDQITRRMLASQYLQRFREQGDVGDIERAQAMARASIQLQPQGNTAAQTALASAMLSYHDFRGALRHEKDALAGEPFNDGPRAQEASLLMELGQYAQAGRILSSPHRSQDDAAWNSTRARYLEETGHLSQARTVMKDATRSIDARAYIPAYDRSWYHLRDGQLAFEAGDHVRANEEFETALMLFPDNSTALLWQAKLYRSERRWRDALRAAQRSANIYPLPQTLGYEADAQRALGNTAQARATEELIVAEQQLFNVQGINDRLLAAYYIQRGIHLHDAFRAAQDDYRRRCDEIYSDDAMAWSLAALGRWGEARPYASKATRLGTQDAMLDYHAGVIALHTGHAQEAALRLHRALREDPHFDPFDAPRAFALLHSIRSRT